MNFNTTKSVVVETTKTASTAIMNESIDVAKINVCKNIISCIYSTTNMVSKTFYIKR